MIHLRIQRLAAATLLVASLIGVLAVPTAVHRHTGAQSGHAHRYPSTSQKQLSDSASTVAASHNDAKGNTSNIGPRFEDISLDMLRDELLFGTAEELLADQTAPEEVQLHSEEARLKHDESIPHLHVNLLGYEVTINLPSDSAAPAASVAVSDLSGQSSSVMRIESQDRISSRGIAIVRAETGRPFSPSLPLFALPSVVRLAGQRPIITFGHPVDESQDSPTISVDSPPPRMG